MEALKINQYSSPLSAAQASGVVIGATDRGWQLMLDDGSTPTAAVAVSCLVKPLLRDRVSVFMDDSGCWITAVLERAEGQPLTLLFNSDTELSCPTGRMSLEAGQGLDLSSRSFVHIQSPVLKLSASLAQHCYKVGTWIGERLETTVNHIRSTSRSHEKVTDQNREAARVSVRKIEQVERTEAGQIDCRARDSLSLRSTHFLARAKKLTKIDGDQIQLG